MSRGCRRAVSLALDPSRDTLLDQRRFERERPNTRLKLAGRGGRLAGKGLLLSAAAPARSLSPIR